MVVLVSTESCGFRLKVGLKNMFKIILRQLSVIINYVSWSQFYRPKLLHINALYLTHRSIHTFRKEKWTCMCLYASGKQKWTFSRNVSFFLFELFKIFHFEIFYSWLCGLGLVLCWRPYGDLWLLTSMSFCSLMESSCIIGNHIYNISSILSKY